LLVLPARPPKKVIFFDRSSSQFHRELRSGEICFVPQPFQRHRAFALALQVLAVILTLSLSKGKDPEEFHSP
jgi:hypothetical protein